MKKKIPMWVWILIGVGGIAAYGWWSQGREAREQKELEARAVREYYAALERGEEPVDIPVSLTTGPRTRPA